VAIFDALINRVMSDRFAAPAMDKYVATASNERVVVLKNQRDYYQGMYEQEFRRMRR
jgi:hypothetical protein